MQPTPDSIIATGALALLILLLCCIGTFLAGARIGRRVAEARLQRLREELVEFSCILGDEDTPTGHTLPPPVPLPNDGRVWPVWSSPARTGCRARRVSQPAPTDPQPRPTREHAA
jgi:hypothetical protein